MHLLRFLTIASSLTAATSVGEPLKNNEYLGLDNKQPLVASPNVKYFAYVVADGDDCDYARNLMPMCANKNSVCRMKPGQEMYATSPICLLYNPSNMADNPFEIETNSTDPWKVCNPAIELIRKIGDPPLCKRDFQCLCLHGADKDCVCAPSDAADDFNGAASCSNGTSTCNEDQYCHYLQTGGIECGSKPYYF